MGKKLKALALKVYGVAVLLVMIMIISAWGLLVGHSCMDTALSYAQYQKDVHTIAESVRDQSKGDQ